MLANDVCRCFNDRCLRKHDCARYVFRRKGNEHTPHVGDRCGGDSEKREFWPIDEAAVVRWQ